MPRIDAHLHVNYNGFDPKGIINYLDKNRFDSCWLLSWEEFESHNPRYEHFGPDSIYSIYKSFPSRIIPFYAPDPRDPKASDKLRHWFEKGFMGCGELKSSVRWDSVVTLKLLDTISSLKLPILFHMEKGHQYLAPVKANSERMKLFFKILNSSRFGGMFPKMLDIVGKHLRWLENWRQKRTVFFPGYLMDFVSLELVLVNFPMVNFVGHGPLFWNQMYNVDVSPVSDLVNNSPAGGISWKLMTAYDNLFADISCIKTNYPLARNRGLARQMVARFSNKLLFGSDNFTGYTESFLDSLVLSPAALDSIYGQNADNLTRNLPH